MCSLRPVSFDGKTIYDHAGAARSPDFPAGPDTYRLVCYERDDAHRSFHHSVIVEMNDENSSRRTASSLLELELSKK